MMSFSSLLRDRCLLVGYFLIQTFKPVVYLYLASSYDNLKAKGNWRKMMAREVS